MEFRSEFFQEPPSTQYNDMIGTAAIDWNIPTHDLHSLADDLGIDTEKYFPVGLEYYYSEGFFHIGVLAVELTDEVNAAENFIEYAQKNNNELPVVRFGKVFLVNPEFFVHRFR